MCVLVFVLVAVLSLPPRRACWPALCNCLPLVPSACLSPAFPLYPSAFLALLSALSWRIYLGTTFIKFALAYNSKCKQTALPAPLYLPPPSMCVCVWLCMGVAMLRGRNAFCSGYPRGADVAVILLAYLDFNLR